MKIYTYTITWNEEDRIPWYLEHYSFADKHFIFDCNSNDNTRDIILKNPKVVLNDVDFEIVAKHEAERTNIKENCWKNCDADWVIVGDPDEFLFYPNLIDLLSTTSATILQPSIAYDMVSENFTINWKEIKNGVMIGNEAVGQVEVMRDSWNEQNLIRGLGHGALKWLKCMLFRPSEIKSMNWGHGCHCCIPTGNLKIERVSSLIFKHYHYVGLEWILERHKKYRSMIDLKCIVEYDFSKKWIEDYIKSGKPI